MRHKLSEFLIFFVLVVLVATLIGAIEPQNAHPFTEQKSFNLDFDQKTFLYEQRQLNETGYPSSHVYTYYGPSNQTFWIELPKNSSIQNSTLTLTGLILVNQTNLGDEIWSVDIGNLTSDEGNEIAIGSHKIGGNTTRIYRNDKTFLWGYDLGNDVYDIKIANLSDSSNRVVLGSDVGVWVLDSNGNEMDNNSIGLVRSLDVNNITADSGNEIVAGGDNLYLLNSTLDLVKNSTTVTAVYGVAIGDVTSSYGGNEIVAGTGGTDNKIYLLNYTIDFNVIWSYSAGGTVNDVAIGNISTDEGLEIVAVSEDKEVYALNSTGHLLWNYTLNDYGSSVTIGEFADTDSGNEIVVGSGGSDVDNRIYILNSTGGLVLSYGADGYVRGVDVGNVTPETGANVNEALAGTTEGSLYELNYDNYPTNINLTVNDTLIWNMTGKFRSSQVINFDNLTNAIQNYLNNCTTEICVVPFVVNSSHKGRLRVSNINISYNYNATADIHNQTVDSWAKTQNIKVNESVISKATNISYTEPALNISIRYMKINAGATSCGFKNEVYSVTTLNGDTYCNVTDKGIKIIPGQSPYSNHLLWDNLIEQKVPVYLNESQPYNTTGVDNYFWIKNITIWSNATEENFTNVIANTTINDAIVKGRVFLNVTWGGTVYNITPTTQCPTMGSVGNGFYACYNDTNGNGVPDFFNWTQPESSSLYSNVFYQAGGTRNLAPNITSANVTPSSGLWGRSFTFNATFEDNESDGINVTLWVFINQSGWQTKGTKTVSGSGNATFEVSSDNLWVGLNKYKFEYFDFNASNPSQMFHSSRNSSEYDGPQVEIHNVTVNHIQGNNTNVSREFGDTTTLLEVYFNDSTGYSNWTDKYCIFWITYNGTDADWGHSEPVNSSGYCNHTFNPNGSYSVGLQEWWATLNESFYNITNQQNFTLRIRGHVNITLSSPEAYQRVLRNQSMSFEAYLADEYGNVMDNSSINTSQYTCNWYFNNTQIGSSQVNYSGYCSYSWIPNCTYQVLGYYPVNVTLSGSNDLNYTVLKNETDTVVELVDWPTVFITSPETGKAFYKGTNLTLNATVNDTCDTCDLNSYNFVWYRNFGYIVVNLNETSGINRTNEPVYITGEELENAGANLTTWRANDTNVTCNGTSVPAQVVSSGEYLDTNSEITFLVNVSARENITCFIYHNETNSLKNTTISFVENGGFESGDLTGWNCSVCSKNDCVCDVTKSGGENNGNYSLEISAEYGTTIASQDLNYPLNSEYIKIRFKVWGEYDTGTYAKLTAGNGICDLTPSSSSIELATAIWNTTLCHNSSFSGADYINLSVKDVGDGGSGIDASHVYIDYICVANSSGDCITFDSGAALETIYGRENITTTLVNSSEWWWLIPVDFNVGSYTVFANFTGSHYLSRENESYIDIFGLANVSYFNFTPIVEGECEGNLCFTGADLKLTCRVLDKNTSVGLYNFTVNFYNESTYIGSEQTNQSGYAVFIWENSTSSTGTKNITCNISNSPNLYYNVTENEMNLSITFSSSTTNGTLNVTPTYRIAENTTKYRNDTLTFNITVNNTGEGNMFGISVIVYNLTGIVGTSDVCSYLASGENCTGNVTFNVSRIAELGNNSLNISLQWSNPDPNGPGFENKTVVINVTNTTYVSIMEDSLNYTVPYGGTRYATFITEDAGNTGLDNVTFILSGGNSSIIYSWIKLNGTAVNDTSFMVERLQQNTTNISVTVPENQQYIGKIYWAYLTAKINDTQCDNSYERCNDTLLINITVTQQDWTVEPRNDSMRVAGIISNTLGEFTLINVTNLKNFTVTINATENATNSTGHSRGSEFFNITLIDNGTTSILPQSFVIQPLSSVYINITYNTTDATEDDADIYTLNLSLENQNSSSTPVWINISRVLRISNFAVDIISPTEASPVNLIDPGDNIEIHANATLGEGEHLTENITWKVWIGGVECPVTNSTNVSGTSYDWVINCTAPQISGNPINNTLILSGNYTTQGIDFNDTENNAVLYNDTTAPKLWSIEIIPQGYSSATELDGDPNVHYTLESGNLTIRVNITENNVTSAVWVVITDPQGGSIEDNMSQGGGYWLYNYTNPGIIGDYEVVVYAKDPAGNANNTENYTMKYFDVYVPMQFYSNFTYPDETSMTVNLSFYKHGTSWRLQHNSSSYFNLTVHKRIYDIKAELLGHTVTFLNADLNASARSQFGGDAGNITNPFRFDYFPNYSYPQINIMPSKFQDPIIGLVIEPNNLTFEQANITINYTDALQAALNIGKTINTQNLEVLVCSNWNYTERSCDGTISNSNYIDVTPSDGLITFQTTPQSAYIVAEGCRNAAGELIDCSGYEETTTTVPSGGGGGGTSTEETGTSEEATSFTVNTNLDATIGDIIIRQGETKRYWLYVNNKLNKNIEVTLSVEGDAKNLLSFSKSKINIDAGDSSRIEAIVSAPENARTGTYTGTISVSGEGEKTDIPVSIRVVSSAEGIISLEVDIIKKRIEIAEPLKFQVKLRNLGTEKELKPTLTYLIKDGKTDKTVKEEKENVTLERLLAFTKTIDLNGTGLDEGEHILEVWAETDGKAVSDMESFELVKPFLATTLGVTLLYTLLVLSIIIATIFIRKYYLSWKIEKEAKKRYLFPVKMSEIPQKSDNSFWIGTLAGSRIKAWLNPNDLTTHVLIAGATGAGKSVGASVIVEEALEQKIPVIVFDPTAQWTGFVRACRDKNLLKYYPKFGIDPKDSKAYKGMIFEMTDPNRKINFKEFMNPGEVTVFTLNKLKPEEFDQAVRNIINSMFRVDWEESTKLKMLVVFDEVHRLLEKYGGKGGYVALEKACREFRKWGIGLIMCSQVLADFKEAIAGNVLTDIQLNTKNLEDIRKAKDKYGDDYAKRITRQGLGVGMIHNPKYNNGKPYFIQFRPTYHNPHKITNEELEEYKEFAKELEEIGKKLDDMKKRGEDVFDMELEFKLAWDKLKLGNFRMAKIYINSLKKKL